LNRKLILLIAGLILGFAAGHFVGGIIGGAASLYETTVSSISTPPRRPAVSAASSTTSGSVNVSAVNVPASFPSIDDSTDAGGHIRGWDTFNIIFALTLAGV